MNQPAFELVSHALCPYVQRVAITLSEKSVPFERIVVDLSRKPDWFTRISPLGKVPLLRMGNEVLFESAAICDYLDETLEPRLHPADPVVRARHRAWIEVASATLNDIAGLYSARDGEVFAAKQAAIGEKFARLEEQLATGSGPYFTGTHFSLVDAAFAPVFRYFDTLERFIDIPVFRNRPVLSAWRQALRQRPSVYLAVQGDYADRLEAFLRARNSHLSRLMAAAA